MLWTFGCSHTAGHGLPDCVDSDGTTPLSGVTSEMGWPSQLAEMLNQPLTNRGIEGVGVEIAWHRAVTDPVQPGDTVVIMWPCWESRIDIFDDPLNVTHPDAINHDARSIGIRNWDPDHEIYFDRFYTLYDRWVRWHLHMTHVHYHFTELRKKDNIRLVQTHFHQYPADWVEIPAPDFSIFDFTKCYFGHDKYRDMPRAVDGNHNGIEANQLFAEELHTEMLHKSLI